MTKRSTDRESVSRIEAVKARQGEDHRVLTLSTGVKLRIKQVPVMLPTEIAMEGMRLRPKAPVMFIEALDREDENQSDPDYQEALQRWQSQILVDMNNAFILLGTEIDSVPRGFARPEDPKFHEQMSVLNRDVGSESLQYLAWVKYCAAPKSDDIALIVGEVGRLSGVGESDVREAVDGFQR